MKINVLMSTYNGEKYLKEQIDSILNQKGVEVYLTIRDDGSTDHTLEIIDDYVKKDPRVKLLRGKNMGPGNSFMELIYQSEEFDYYALSDQDDIWLEDKLISALNILGERKYPCLYCSNQIVTDSTGKQIGTSYKETPPTDLANTMIVNTLRGCTMLMNRKLRDLLIREDIRPDPEFLRLRMHDVWIVMLVNCFGRIIYDPEPHILYRQHANNVSGAVTGSGLSFLKKFGSAGLKYPRQAAGELKKTFHLGIRPQAKAIINAFLNLNTLRGKIAFCRNRKLMQMFSKDTRYIRLKVMLGIW